MERPKWVAIMTGALAIALGVGYLLLVQLLDYRGGRVFASAAGAAGGFARDPCPFWPLGLRAISIGVFCLQLLVLPVGSCS